MRRRARIVQIVSDLTKKPISELRILDLASLEGHYSFEFAQRGARVTGIEGRQSNIEKALALGERLNLSVEFVKDDVRNLRPERHGTFDVILCLGILYHLGAPDIAPFLKAIYESCRDFAVIDTHFAFNPREEFDRYSGWYYTEYESEPSHEEQEEASWSSIGNIKSFWPTRPSLINALADAGFSSVVEVHFPAMNDMPSDRVTVVAFKGAAERPLVEFTDASVLGERLPETPQMPPVQPQVHALQTGVRPSPLRRFLSKLTGWIFVSQREHE